MEAGKTFNERLEEAGIVTIRETDEKGNPLVFLEYGGKRLKRPMVNAIESFCKKHFGVDI